MVFKIMQFKFNFDDKSETEMLYDEIELLNTKQEKLRKALFKRHGELQRSYKDINERLRALEQPCEIIEYPLFKEL